jgi:hypothetical protein
MLPGPDQIVACPHCNGLAKYMTLLSGNTFGARFWTDGKKLAPMLPLPPAVAKCHHCAECYWLADAKAVGTVKSYGGDCREIDPAWTSAQEVQEPSEEDYYQALEKGFAADARQERRLRVLAWWRRNDTFRDTFQAGAGRFATAQGACRKNLEALASLLNEADENDRLMKAEVLRELGDFESAEQALSRVTSAEYTQAVRQLRKLCDSADTCVRELRFDD